MGDKGKQEREPETLFKDNLQRIRKARGWTQQHLANEIKASVIMIKRYEAGEAQPTLTILTRLATTLGVSIDELAFANGGVAGRRLDPEMLKRFEEVEKLPQEEREAVRFFLDSVIERRKLRSLLESSPPLKPPSQSKS